MAGRGRGHAALWVKLYELELQLRLMRAARGEAVVVEEDGGDDDDDVDVSRAGSEPWWSVAFAAAAAETDTCRGRQYDAYMRRRDARRHTMGGGVAAAAVTERREEGQTARPRGGAGAGARAAAAATGRLSPLAVSCAAGRDMQEVKRSPAMSTPTTPRKETGGLPRTRTVNGGTAKPSSHQRRSSLGAVPSDFGESVTPRPFLRRGSGTGGATTTTTTPRLRAPPARVHDLQANDVAMASPRRPPPPRDQLAQAAARRRHHSRSVSELPLHHHTATAALDSPRSAVELPLPSPSPRPRKQWGSPETPREILTVASSGGGDSHRDFAKGLKKLLSFVRKSSSSSNSKSGGDQHHSSPARPPRKAPVISRGWHAAAAASPVTA
ncbi:uncharacterized protein LOC121055283 [Oryza brachyantha]|uniref:uncharacterized protein LOC121055283 n=1 Tax=Oryza brachyantha TaxID=4533 RepID=UPI001ADB0A03|nr:uncharacterized protein LOC121055283 [Oryza brachyantha]